MLSQVNSRGTALLAITLAWAVFLTIVGSPEVILFTVPVFMLAAPLALGRYVGEDLVARLAERARPARRASAAASSGRFGETPASVRGSLLIASNLAGRAPPLAFA